MAESASPRVVWTGLVPTTTGRKNPKTGRVREYRVVLFDDGTAVCDCPAAIFRATRNPDGTDGPCKHIEIARRIQAGAPPSTPAPATPRGGAQATKGPAAPAPADEFLSEFEDDALMDLPQVRHERRD